MANRKQKEYAVVSLRISDAEEKVRFKAYLEMGIVSCEKAVDSLKVQFKAAGLDSTKNNIIHYKSRIAGFKWLQTRM